MGLADSDAFCTAAPEFWRDAALELGEGAKSADAVFISCANISAIEVIEELESRLNKPVVTSNQAALWSALRTIRIGDNLDSLGRLLTL